MTANEATVNASTPSGSTANGLQLNLALIDSLRRDLAAARFHLDDVARLVGDSAFAAWRRDQRMPAALMTRAILADTHAPQRSKRLATLAALFLCGEEVSAVDVDDALEHVGARGLSELGLCEIVGEASSGTVRARLILEPHDVTDGEATHHWWIASDLPEHLTGCALAPDHVLGIGGATRTLAALLPPPRQIGGDKRGTAHDPAPEERAVAVGLDLGTGCGIIALYLSLRCRHVIATDINPRACRIAAFNAALNGIDLDIREGSLFDPVAGERIDLIMANPPFVITPQALRERGIVTYRDGGKRGDALMREVLVGAAGHLAPGGRAIVVGNWEIADDVAEWSDAVEVMLTDVDAHAWVIQREELAVTDYVEMWMRDNAASIRAPRRQVEEDFATWVADFSARNVRAIGMGIVALSRGRVAPEKSGSTGVDSPAVAVGIDGSTWQREYSRIETSTSANGAYLDSVLTLVAQGRVDPPGEARLVRTTDVREERHYIPGSPDPDIIIATQGDGFGQRIRVSSHAAAVLGACDGELTLDQITAAIAAITGEDVDAIRTEVAPQIRAMVVAGMLRDLD